ncbi:MAG: hydantoinase/oxoprolinase family protein [bacterium]|nr:hydantoinase/oxoprolinase family protein [bacterium]MDE0353593.1 hydantoinase/oxoprolinase family protein [bacterium]
MTERRHRLAVDIGGTFVDAIAYDEQSGKITVRKSPTTPAAPADGVITATRATGASLEEASVYTHGTTLGLNAILERRGSVTGIITNAGFRDIFEIARGDLPRGSMYDFRYRRPELLVKRRHTVGVPGRIDHRGKVVEELDHDAVIEAGRLLSERGVESVAVCFLHSYANSEHEKAAKSILTKAFPDLSVSVSVDLVREYREYERTSTAVTDAYIRPILGRYLTDLEDRLRDGGFDGSFLIMRSAGGAMTSEIARVSPLLTVFSGPAGGIAGTISLGEATGRSSLISFDVGGTSLDACVIVDGAPTEVYEAEIEALPIRIPVFDIRTIGAGGGSIAWMDKGLLRVGPRSAGAVPGPICYGRGNTEPTVTDAALCLGYLAADEFLGGEMSLDEAAAVRGVTEKLAEPLGMSTERAAASVFDVLLARTVGAIREITVERGLDPREFSLVAFGGAGPMLAPLLAREMDLPEVVVPAAPAVFSAWGMLMSDLEYDLGQTVLTMLDDAALAQVEGVFAQLESEADQVLAAQSVPPGSRVLLRRLDLRYNGQEHTLSVELQEADDTGSVIDRFHRRHVERYGHSLTEEVQILTARVRAIGRLEKPSALLGGSHTAATAATESRAGERQAFDFATRQSRPFPIYERSLLEAGVEIDGPAIIREPTSVTIIHGDQTAVPDASGNLVVGLREKVAR